MDKRIEKIKRLKNIGSRLEMIGGHSWIFHNEKQCIQDSIRLKKELYEALEIIDSLENESKSLFSMERK